MEWFKIRKNTKESNFFLPFLLDPSPQERNIHSKDLDLSIHRYGVYSWGSHNITNFEIFSQKLLEQPHSELVQHSYND